MQQAAQRLAASLEEALAVLDQREADRESERRQAKTLRDRVSRRLARLSRSLELDSFPAEQWDPPREIRARIRLGQDLSLCWITAVCDIWQALMQLYAHPEAQPCAQRIALLIRAVQVAQVPEIPEEALPSTRPAMGPTELRAEMDTCHARFDAAWERSHNLTREGLQAALSITRTLFEDA